MEPLIRYVTPYALDGNLAEAMNYEISISPKGSYVAFVDRDIIWLDPKFGHKIASIIEEHGTGFYTCVTNRTNCEWQRMEGVSGNDILRHTDWCNAQYNIEGNTVEDHTESQLWSGHLMICPVDHWTPIKMQGLLGVDNDIHLQAKLKGHKVLLITGIYIYHYYSNFDGEGGHQQRDKSHLK